MKKRFHAVIIGLGPGGAAAAKRLCQAGAEVLVLDHSPPVEKPCGGCISARWMDVFEWLHAQALFKKHPVSTLWLTAPGRRPAVFTTSQPSAYFVERKSLNLFFRGAAAEAGALILPYKASSIKPVAKGFEVLTEHGTFSGDWIIGADGVNGITRRTFKPPTGLRYRAVCQEMKTPPHLVHKLENSAVIELAGIPYGYGWIFPRGETLNVGAGSFQTRGNSGGKGLLKFFAKLLARYGLGSPSGYRGSLINCPGGSSPKAAFGRALLVGDAAGLSDPFLGEGIGQAAYSGMLAAEAVLKSDATWFQSRLVQGLVREHASARRLAKTLALSPGVIQGLIAQRPGALELGFKMLRGSLSHTHFWKALALKIFQSQPDLDSSMSGLYSKLMCTNPLLKGDPDAAI